MKPKLQENKYYKIIAKRQGRELFYTCKILKIDGKDIHIEDKFGKKLLFSDYEIEKATEVEESEVKKPYRIVSFRSTIKR